MQELHVEMHLLATTSPGAWQRLADTTGREIVRATSKTLNDIMSATPSQAHTGAGAGGRGAEGSAEASPLDAAENTAPRFPAKNMEGEAEKAEPRRPITAATALGELRAGALMLAGSLAEAASGTTSPASNTCSLAVGRRVAQAQVCLHAHAL